jgi:glutamine amidotransferase
MAILKPSNKPIFKRKLHECWTSNPDGAGFMWSHNKTLYIRKGFMTFRKFYRTFRAMERDFPEADFAIHFRIATHGGVNGDNCHPFKIAGHNVGVIHNGILSVTIPNKYQSDTSYFCSEILSKFPKGWMYNPAWVSMLNKYAQGEFSKFIVMDCFGKWIIFNESAGEWEDGLWYSNKSYGFAKYNPKYNWENEYPLAKSYLALRNYDVECALCFGKFDYNDIKWFGGQQLCCDCYQYQKEAEECAGRISSP